MPFSIVSQTLHDTKSIIERSLRILKSNPYVLIYPYLALLFVLLTSPFIGKLVFALWHAVDRPEVIEQISQITPPELAARLGLVTFAVFYTFFVTSFFSCMIAASTLAQLEGKNPSVLYGLKIVMRRLFRVTKFAVLAIFFLPLGIIAQRQKFSRPKGLFEAITSSFSLNMAQLAPAIVIDRKSVMETIRYSVDTLGHRWKESLFIRVGTFGVILLLASLSFLPKVIENLWFDSSSAHIVGWIVTALLGASSYVVVRVLSAVLTTTLYFEAKSKK